MLRRGVLHALAGAAVIALAAAPADAQGTKLPDGPIKLVAGFAPGGSSDAMARLVAKHLEGTLQRAVIVENKAGAGGRIAAQDMTRATPDGTTFLVANIVNALLIPLTFSDAKYHPLKDFTLIGRGADFQIAMATGPMTGAKDLKEFVAWAKSNPDKGVYGVPAAGSIPHLYSLKLAKSAGLDMRMLPMKGGGPIANELIAGQIPLGAAGTADFSELHRAGNLRLIAVSGSRRAPGLDDVATFAEQGFAGFDSNGWLAFFGPPGMSKEVQDLLSDAVRKALQDPDVNARLTVFGFIVTPGGPDDLRAQIERDIKQWEPLIEAAGVKK